MKKTFIIVIVLLFSLFSSAYAMLRVLEPELSLNLQAIAREHVATTQNADAEAIVIEGTWLREFWNIGVDVYKVEIMVNESKITVPVSVYEKRVLSVEELSLLEANDLAAAPAEPQIRIMTADAELEPEKNLLPFLKISVLVNILLFVLLLLCHKKKK